MATAERASAVSCKPQSGKAGVVSSDALATFPGSPMTKKRVEKNNKLDGCLKCRYYTGI